MGFQVFSKRDFMARKPPAIESGISAFYIEGQRLAHEISVSHNDDYRPRDHTKRCDRADDTGSGG